MMNGLRATFRSVELFRRHVPHIHTCIHNDVNNSPGCSRAAPGLQGSRATETKNRALGAQCSECCNAMTSHAALSRAAVCHESESGLRSSASCLPEHSSAEMHHHYLSIAIVGSELPILELAQTAERSAARYGAAKRARAEPARGKRGGAARAHVTPTSGLLPASCHPCRPCRRRAPTPTHTQRFNRRFLLRKRQELGFSFPCSLL